MPVRMQIALSFFAGVIFYDYITITNLKIRNHMLENQVEGLEHMLHYLGDVMTRNNIELDEFDIIALNNPDLNLES